MLGVVSLAVACSGEIGGSAANDAATGADDAASIEDAATECGSDWWDCQYPTRLPLEIDHSEGPLSDVPVLVVLTPVRTDMQVLSVDGLRFVDSAQNLLDYEIDSLGIDGRIHAWVRVPELVTGSNVFYAYYGATDVSDAQNPTGVWSNRFRGVWHLSDDPSASIVDSTGNGNNGQSQGEMSASNGIIGQVGRAVQFDGVDDFIQVANSASLNLAGDEITLSAWVYYTTPQITDVGVIVKSNGNVYNYQLGIEDNSVGNFRVRTDDADKALSRLDSATNLTTNNWHYLVGVYSGSNTRLFIDGELDATDTPQVGSILSTTEPPLLGRRALGDERYLNGAIDEARVESMSRGGTWIRFQYRTMRDEVISYGATEQRP